MRAVHLARLAGRTQSCRRFLAEHAKHYSERVQANHLMHRQSDLFREQDTSLVEQENNSSSGKHLDPMDKEKEKSFYVYNVF